MQSNTDRQTIVFRLPADEYDAVKAFAAAKGSSIQQFLAEAVREKLTHGGVGRGIADESLRDTSFVSAAVVFAELTKRRNYGGYTARKAGCE